MGYQTEFRGGFSIQPQLKPKDLTWLQEFNKTRHCGPDGMEKDPKLSLYCQWMPTQDGKALVWDGNEKFYNYVPWLQYLITNFFEPKGYRLGGTVQWRGEGFDDRGSISVVNGKFIKVQGKPRA